VNKYTGVITFKIDIEAVDMESAEHIAKQALPNHFLFRDSKGGVGNFLRPLPPVVYDAEDVAVCINNESYWRNR